MSTVAERNIIQRLDWLLEKITKIEDRVAQEDANKTELESLRDSHQRRQEWLHKAKQSRGYPDNISFDVVWADTCKLADKQLDTSTTAARGAAAAALSQQLAEMCAGEDLLTQENYDAWVKHFRNKVIEECANTLIHYNTKPPVAGRIWKDEVPYVDEEAAYRRIMVLKDGSTPGFT